MAGEVDLDQRHTFFKNLPPPEDFKDGKKFDAIFDLMMKYVVKLYGSGKIRSAMKENPGSSVVDLVTASDCAYVVAVIEDKKDVWEQQAELKRHSEEERARIKAMPEFKKALPKFTSRRGLKYEYLGSGWSKDGVRFYNEVLKTWREQMKNEEFWDMMQVAWEVYEEENGLGKVWRKTVSWRQVNEYHVICKY